MSLNSKVTPGTPELTLISTVVEQYDYVYNGSSLTRMVKTTTTTADEETTTSTDTLFFAYDASGSPLAVTYNGVDYYYTANIQGDIVGIVDNTGTQVVAYTYDAWGNILTTTGTLAETLGKVNPLRYRGYVYDVDTGLFYLQSRYYNPEIGRFLNADALVSTGQGILGNNMFAYCLSNPTNCIDPTGNSTHALRRDPAQISYEYWGGGGGGGGEATLFILSGIYEAIVSFAQNLIRNHEAKESRAVSEALALLAYASTAASPPPPNKGGRGTQVTSKTLYQKGGKNGYRIDVENPGTRTGQIHLQQGGTKYYYNVNSQTFHIGSSTGPLAPNAIQELLLLPEVIIAIAKGLIILGY